ncbi:MAG: aspartyl protease family protein [Saprospiraceae bacterium]
MGLVFAEIELINYDDIAYQRKGLINKSEIRRLAVNALVDTGAYMLVINENVQNQLGLEVLGSEIALLADGSQQELPLVGPIEVRFKNRRTIVEALVVPGESQVLLGAIPMEGMDVIIDPNKGELALPPSRPYVAGTILK